MHWRGQRRAFHSFVLAPAPASSLFPRVAEILNGEIVHSDCSTSSVARFVKMHGPSARLRRRLGRRRSLRRLLSVAISDRAKPPFPKGRRR